MKKIDLVHQCLQSPVIAFNNAYKDLHALITLVKYRVGKWEINIEMQRIRQKKLKACRLVTNESLLHQFDIKQKLSNAIDVTVKKMRSRSATLHKLTAVFEYIYEQKNYLRKIKMKLVGFARQ